MTETRRTTSEEARRVGDEIGVDWDRLDLEQFRFGMDVEFEHGSHDPQTDVTGDDPILTGKIALAHMKEFPDYYERLERMGLGREELLTSLPPPPFLIRAGARPRDGAPWCWDHVHHLWAFSPHFFDAEGGRRNPFITGPATRKALQSRAFLFRRAGCASS